MLATTNPAFLGATHGHTMSLGQISLMPVTRTTTDLDVAKFRIPYNVNLGHPALDKFMVASHYAYMTIKITLPKGPISVPAHLPDGVICTKKMYLAAIAKEGITRNEEPTLLSPRRARIITEVAVTTKNIPLRDDPSQVIKIWDQLDPKLESALISFLLANTDVFAWQPSDMSGLSRQVIEHYLCLCPGARPIKQKVRRQVPDQKKFIQEEVERLQKAGFIWEVLHPDWIANPVVLPKANGDRRMCTDFSDIGTPCWYSLSGPIILNHDEHAHTQNL